MKWKRIKVKNDGTSPEFAAVVRTYGEKGKSYPRLTVSIYPNYLTRPGVRIGVNGKRDSQSWWTECNLPDELIGELIDMLEEYRKKGES